MGIRRGVKDSSRFLALISSWKVILLTGKGIGRRGRAGFWAKEEGQVFVPGSILDILY